MRYIVVLMLCFILCGCATATNRKDYVTTHPELSDNIKQNILKAEISTGMTKDQILASWGKPMDINKTIIGNQVSEQWVYSDKSLVYFTNDICDCIQN